MIRLDIWFAVDGRSAYRRWWIIGFGYRWARQNLGVTTKCIRALAEKSGDTGGFPNYYQGNKTTNIDWKQFAKRLPFQAASWVWLQRILTNYRHGYSWEQSHDLMAEDIEAKPCSFYRAGWHYFLNYSMKIKEQTRKLAAGCLCPPWGFR